jgi:hypothetical protein
LLRLVTRAENLLEHDLMFDGASSREAPAALDRAAVPDLKLPWPTTPVNKHT